MEGLIFAYALVIAIIIVIQWVIAKKFEKIAFQKGYDEEIHSFAMCFWLGVVGYLYVIALPDLTLPRNNIETEKTNISQPTTQQTEQQIKMYSCPKCKAQIPYGTEKCPICQQKFGWK